MDFTAECYNIQGTCYRNRHVSFAKEESMKRYWLLPGAAATLLIGLIVAGGTGGGTPAQAARVAPAVVFLSEPISMTLDLQGAAEITRTAANMDGDGYIQFAALPFTTTASSTVNLTLD